MLYMLTLFIFKMSWANEYVQWRDPKTKKVYLERWRMGGKLWNLRLSQKAGRTGCFLKTSCLDRQQFLWRFFNFDLWGLITKYFPNTPSSTNGNDQRWIFIAHFSKLSYVCFSIMNVFSVTRLKIVWLAIVANLVYIYLTRGIEDSI